MRTTRHEIDLQLKELNQLLGRPLEPWLKLPEKDAGSIAQIGNIHLYRDHLGYRVYEMCNEGGGVRDATYKTFKTKKELCGWLDGAIYSAYQMKKWVENA